MYLVKSLTSHKKIKENSVPLVVLKKRKQVNESINNDNKTILRPSFSRALYLLFLIIMKPYQLSSDPDL